MTIKTPEKASRRKFFRTEETAREVSAYCSVGTPVADISRIVGMSEPTLRKLYTEELKTAGAKATAKVAGKLYSLCMDGNVTAIIFWMKTRGRWSERAAEEEDDEALPVTVTIGRKSGRVTRVDAGTE